VKTSNLTNIVVVSPAFNEAACKKSKLGVEVELHSFSTSDVDGED
jgi:hypothetical protein